MAATLTELLKVAVFEAKFMLPWSFSEEAAAEKHMAQLQHNMWVTNANLPCSGSSRAAASGLKFLSRRIPLPASFDHSGEKFWRCVETGEPRGSSMPNCHCPD
jgi:hypothetical protein